MNFTPEQVDLIVARVLEQIGTAEAPARAANTPAGSGTKPASVAAAVRIDAPVITQALLAESVNGSARVAIGTKAILTPSARDWVRTRGVEIIREGTPQTKSASRSQVIVVTSTPQVLAVIDGLRQEGIIAERKLTGTPTEAAALATSALCRGEAEQVVLFTDQPELAACLANRNEQVRAAPVGDAAAVERALKILRANLLAVDPTGRGAYELKSMLRGVARR